MALFGHWYSLAFLWKQCSHSYDKQISKWIYMKNINKLFINFLYKLNKLLTVASFRQHWGLFSFMRWQRVGEVPMYGVIGGNPRTYLKIRKNKYFVLHLIENFKFLSHGTLYINYIIITSVKDANFLSLTLQL